MKRLDNTLNAIQLELNSKDSNLSVLDGVINELNKLMVETKTKTLGELFEYYEDLELKEKIDQTAYDKAEYLLNRKGD